MGSEQIEIIEYIKRLDDKELRNFVEERIEFLEEDEDGMYPDTIGYIVDYNPESTILTKENENTIADTILRNNYMGYIPYGTRIVYGIATDKEGLVKTNLGRYYYIDDDDYIFGFCKSIRDKEITDIYMLFDLIFNYIQDYFGIIEQIDRDKMTNLILKKEYHFFDPIYENRLSMFKKKGNAQCSEIALAAQNILSFFAIESNYIFGSLRRITTEDGHIPEDLTKEIVVTKDIKNISELVEEINKEKKKFKEWGKIKNEYPQEGHAYNIVKIEDEGEIISLLIDFSAGVYMLDMKHKIIGEAPFIYYLDDDKEETIRKMREESETIETNDYLYIIEKPLVLVMDRKLVREYTTKGNKRENKVLIKAKN